MSRRQPARLVAHVHTIPGKDLLVSLRLPIIASLIFLSPILPLTGCSISTTAAPATSQGASIQGHVHGGQQAVVGAHVYLFAANTTANAGSGISASSTNASISLLNAVSTGNADSLGAYVLTGAGGSFSITGDYTCAVGQQVYLYALGGNTGAGTNSAAGFLSALGQCPSSGTFAAQVPNLWVDEVTTVATAYALAGYATDATHISSDATATSSEPVFLPVTNATPQSLPLNPSATQATNGIANAFANVAQLVDITSGSARANNPAGTATVPQALLNTLADVLAACVNATDVNPTNCTTLFSNAKSAGASGTTPTDTATAAINIAHNPASNISSLFNLVSGTGAPYQPTLSTPPADLTLALHFTGGSINSVQDVAIDSFGDAWLANSGTVVLLSPAGTFLSGTSGYTTPNLSSTLRTIAIDINDNAWVAGANTYFFSLNNAGTFSSPYTIAGGGAPHSFSLAVDGLSNVWVDNANLGYLFKYDTSGNLLSPTAGATVGAATLGLAPDSSSRVWANLYYFGKSDIISSSDTISSTYTGSGQNTGSAIAMRPAIDSTGNYWVASQNGNLVEISSTGTFLSGSTGYSLGDTTLRSVALDGNNNAWVTNGSSNSSLFEVSSSGSTLSPASGFSPASSCSAMGNAIDGSGNVWMACSASGGGVYELIGAAAPVVTPLSVAVKLGKIATRP